MDVALQSLLKNAGSKARKDMLREVGYPTTPLEIELFTFEAVIHSFQKCLALNPHLAVILPMRVATISSVLVAENSVTTAQEARLNNAAVENFFTHRKAYNAMADSFYATLVKKNSSDVYMAEVNRLLSARTFHRVKTTAGMLCAVYDTLLDRKPDTTATSENTSAKYINGFEFFTKEEAEPLKPKWLDSSRSQKLLALNFLDIHRHGLAHLKDNIDSGGLYALQYCLTDPVWCRDKDSFTLSSQELKLQQKTPIEYAADFKPFVKHLYP